MESLDPEEECSCFCAAVEKEYVLNYEDVELLARKDPDESLPRERQCLEFGAVPFESAARKLDFG